MKFFLKKLKEYAVVALILYGLLLGIVYCLQDSLLYFPAQYTPLETAQIAGTVRLKPWPGAPAPYRGFVSVTELPDAAARGTIIVVHGNADSALGRRNYIDALQPLGFRVLLYEFPGYGSREGTLGEASFVSDLREVIRQVEQSGRGPVYLVAESLGCGVAASAVSDSGVPIKGLLLIAPWDELAHVAQAHYPFLPAKWLVKDRFDSVANLAAFRFPVVIVRLGRDEVIPTQLQQHLYDSLTAPKKMILFPEATHNGWPGDPAELWWREAMQFIAPQ